MKGIAEEFFLSSTNNIVDNCLLAVGAVLILVFFPIIAIKEIYDNRRKKALR